MRKLSQHYQHQHYGSNIVQKCQETPGRFKRLESFKNKNDFLQWLKSLPFEIRYLAVKVQAPQMAETIRKTLRRLEFCQESQTDNKKSLSNIKSTKTILDSLVLASDGRQFFDSICFDFNFIEVPQKLYDLLMYSGETTKKFNPIQDMNTNRKPLSESIKEIKGAKSKEELSNILVRVLRHEVFYNTCNRDEQIQISQEKNRKKELSFYWKNLNEEQKLHLLRLGHSNMKELSQFLVGQGIEISVEELEKQVGQLIKLQKNEFCNRIFKCKLKKSLTSLTDYHSLVYNKWKHDFEVKNNSKRRRINRRYPQHAMKVTDCKYYDNQQYQEQEKPIKKKQSKSKPQPQQMMFHEKQHSIYSFETNETEIYQKLEENISRRSSKTNFLNDFIQKKIFNNIVECSDAISKEANYYHMARLIAYERIKFILQIYGIPIKVFGSCANGIAIKNSDIDIAIDSTIMNYFLNYPQNERPKKSLEQLYQIFGSFGCMKNLQFYRNARIPILKMSVNTEEAIVLDQNCFAEDVTEISNYLNRAHRGTCIEIDITIETYSNVSGGYGNGNGFDVVDNTAMNMMMMKSNHLGVNTTKRINQFFKEVKTLKYLVIIMKYFLSNADLNATYKDGMNTYAIIVMFLAAVRHLKLQKEQNATVVFEQILKFYYKDFDEKAYGIDLRNKEHVFYSKQKKNNSNNKMSADYRDEIRASDSSGGSSSNQMLTKADLQVLDPQNNGFDMTRKCYKYYLIKELFGTILKKCFDEPRKIITSYFLKDEEIYCANTKNSFELKEKCLEAIASKLENPFIQMLSRKENKEEQGLFEGSSESKGSSINRPSIVNFYEESMPLKEEPTPYMIEVSEVVRTASMIA